MRNHQKLASFIVGSGFILSQLAIILYVPILPALHHAFHIGLHRVLFLISINLIGYALGQLFWGTVSDYIGRKKAVVIALLLCLAALLLLVTSHHYLLFELGTFLLGFAVATFTSIGSALMRDIHGKTNTLQIIAYVGIAMAITPTISGILGSHLLHWLGWRSIFYGSIKNRVGNQI